MKRLFELTVPLLLFTMQGNFVHAQNGVSWKSKTERIGEMDYHLISVPDLPEGAALDSASLDFSYGALEETAILVGRTSPLQGKGPVRYRQLVLLKGPVDTLRAAGSVSFAYFLDGKTYYGGQELDFFWTAPVEEASPKDTKHLQAEGRSPWGIFALSFLGGLAALLTPCVFPMIPMTVSFFTKGLGNRRNGLAQAAFYALFIILIYVLLGSLVTSLFGAAALNALSTNVWFNLAFFVLLIVFAMSFLGAFEVVLPHGWVNWVDRKSHEGGVIGIFFMALALALVSFSCTGPIVGTLLVEAASKGGAAPIIGMLGFSLALAIPFALFAAFPGWMQRLPRSGGWLNSAKVFLGFLELAFAFKFLSNADLVLQLHWLERETFLAIWVAIFLGLALYLLGQLALPHDAPMARLSVPRLLLGLSTLAFVAYMVPGLWGAPLKLISGFPPPMQYSESPNGLGIAHALAGTEAVPLPEGAEPGPHGIPAFHDYDSGLAYAREVGRPVLLDFTGHACVNCRKMEEKVWSDPRILHKLMEEVVLVSLYVDDKRPLPEDQRYRSKLTGREITQTGQKWSEFQQQRFQANAQPLYVLMDPGEKLLVPPVGYTPDIEDYAGWLEIGIANFNDGDR